MKIASRFLLAIPLLILSGCWRMQDTTPQLNINYPAAYVVNGESNSVSIIDLTTQQLKETISLGDASMGGHSMGGTTDQIMWPHHIYLSPDGTRLSLGVPGTDLSGGHSGSMAGMKGRVVLLDSRTGKLLANQETPAMNHNAAFSPDGTELWTVEMDEAGKALVYDATTLSLKQSIPVGEEPAEVTFSSNGQYAFVANGHSNSITVIRVATKTVVKTIPVGEDPVGAWPGADGKMYVDNEKGQSISIIDVGTLAVTETISLGFIPGYAAFNPVLNELWVSQAASGNKVVVFHRMNDVWMKAGEIVTGLDAHAIAFTKDGSLAYVTNQGAGSVSIIDTKTRSKIKDIVVGKKPNGIVLKN
ncbi:MULTISPECIES: YncE family protein [Larkinella]|uniref:YncE family protein n=1 Tax=Larkinella punicea TaxID=2315727 RepID=A0A368JHT6_9BACT|nr:MULTISPECIES: YncE family protein [Larkinella]RCR67112.1 YncE family protein [Larkinella punicea]